MVSMLASNLVDHGFEPQTGQTKDYTIGICCFSAKDAALRRNLHHHTFPFLSAKTYGIFTQEKAEGTS